MKKIIAIIMLAFAFVAKAETRGLIVAWNPNPVQDRVTNYVIHISTNAATLTNKVFEWTYDAGATTGLVMRLESAATNKLPAFATNWNVHVLTQWTRFPAITYLAATAVNDRGLSSDYSEMLIWTNRPSMPDGMHLFNMGSVMPFLSFPLVTNEFIIQASSDVTGPWDDALRGYINPSLLTAKIGWWLKDPVIPSRRFWRLVSDVNGVSPLRVE